MDNTRNEVTTKKNENMERKDRYTHAKTYVDEDGVVIPPSEIHNYLIISKIKTYERRNAHDVRVEWTVKVTKNPQLDLFGGTIDARSTERANGTA